MQSENKIAPSIWILCIISGLPLFAETVYTPSLNRIACDFATSMNNVEQTLTIYLIGFAIGIFFWGPISDKIGRKPCLIAGLCVFIIGCIICYLSTDISTLMIGRFIQPLGSAVGSVLGQAIARDAFSGKDLTRVYLSTSIAISIFPAIGPSIGSVLAEILSWKSSFIFLILASIVIINVVYFKLPETLDKSTIEKTKILKFAKVFFHDKNILTLGSMVGISLGMSFSYFAEAPFFFIKKLKLTQEQYGLTFIFVAISAMIGGVFGKKLNKRFDSKTTIYYGMMTILSGITLSIITVTMNHYQIICQTTSAVLSIISRAVMMPGQIILSNVILSIALANYRSRTGSASSLLGLYYYSISSCVTLFMGILHRDSLFTMPMYFLGLFMLMFVVYKKLNLQTE